MRAIKMQTNTGRTMSETGVVPRLFHLGQFWDGDKPLFENVNVDLDDLPDGTVLRVNRHLFDQNPQYFRKEPSNTGEPWAKLDRENETHHYIERPMFSSQWSGFLYAAEIFIIYTPES